MKRKKLLSLAVSAVLAVSLLSGCAGQKTTGSSDASGAETSAASGGDSSQAAETSGKDASSETSGEKIKIVIECQQSHIREDFEANMEEQFPDVDIVLNYNYSKNVLFSLQQALTHHVTPDIYMCEFLPNLGDEMLSEYFYDLAAESFVNRYYLNAVKACSTATGGLYYLPGPSYVYGILYDKTAFQELGLSVPTSYSEFAELCHTINDMDLVGYEPDPADNTKQVEVPVQAFVPTIMWPDMFQILFNTMNYESSFQGIQNAKWLSEYQEGRESAVGHMEPAAEKYLKMFDDGILSLDFWSTEPFYRTLKLYQYHTSLMTIECQQGFEYNETYGSEDPDNYHEMGIMPIFTSDEPDSGYLYGIPRSYFGITKSSAQDPEKLAVILDILDYLSTVEGQKKLISGSDYFGFLKNDNSVNGPLYSEVQDVIKDDHVIATFLLGGRDSRGRVESYLHEHTPELVKGELSVEQWLAGADEVRDSVLHPQPPEVFGQVAETLLPIQSAYVEGLSLLHSMDADIGFVQVSQHYGTLQYMFSGDITEPMIKFNSPEIASMAQPIEGDMEFVVVEMTGNEMLELVQKNYPDGNGTAALAGVDMEVDLSKPGREQYLSLTMDGKPLDMDHVYRVATIRGAVPHLAPVKEYKDLTFQDMFLRYLNEAAKGTITPPEQLKLTENK